MRDGRRCGMTSGALATLVVTLAASTAHTPARTPTQPQGAAGRDAAQPPAAEHDAERGWIDGDHLTGDWGGARSALGERGVTIDALYASEVFTRAARAR